MGDFVASFLPLVVLFAIFYFLVIRPQQQQVKKHREMLDNLAKGDKIVTAGGLLAEVVKVEEKFFKIKLADGVEVRLERDSVMKKDEA